VLRATLLTREGDLATTSSAVIWCHIGQNCLFSLDRAGDNPIELILRPSLVEERRRQDHYAEPIAGKSAVDPLPETVTDA
jgi:hypothetical protein